MMEMSGRIYMTKFLGEVLWPHKHHLHQVEVRIVSVWNKKCMMKKNNKRIFDEYLMAALLYCYWSLSEIFYPKEMDEKIINLKVRMAKYCYWTRDVVKRSGDSTHECNEHLSIVHICS